MIVQSVLLAAALLATGCKKKEAAPAPEPTKGSAAAVPVTPPPAATPDAAVAPVAPAGSAAAAAPAGSTAVATVSQLTDIAIDLPAFKGAPAGSHWSAAPAPSGEINGDLFKNYMNKDDYWMSIRLLDCNAPFVKAFATKPATERGDLTPCFEAATGKLKDFPLYSPNDTRRVVKAGHLAVIVTLGPAAKALKPADLEAFLGDVDLAAIAKL